MDEHYDDLYSRMMIPVATLANLFQERSWKTTRISDGSILYGGGWFAVGIETPNGLCVMHFKMIDWDLFKCKEIEKMPKCKHTDISALLSLTEESVDN